LANFSLLPAIGSLPIRSLSNFIAHFDNGRIHGPKQVTDVYLLALAVKHAGRFVTFDGSVPLSAVLRTEKEHLAVI